MKNIKQEEGDVPQVHIRQGRWRTAQRLGHLTELEVGQRWTTTVSFYDLQRVPERLRDTLAHLNSLSFQIIPK